MTSGTQMCKTDIVYRLLCMLAVTDHHGLREEMDYQYRKVLFTIGIYENLSCQFVNSNDYNERLYQEL